MISFDKFIEKNDDLNYINDVVIKKLSNSNSNIKMDFYYNHIRLCAKISYELAMEKNIEAKNVVIAALLHDIGKCDNLDRHEITGSIFAKNILKKMKYSSTTINNICFCIEHHIHGITKKNTIESQIVANADCISYITNFNYFKEYEFSNNKFLHIAIDKLLIKIKKIYDIMDNENVAKYSNELKRIERELEEKKMEVAKANDYLQKDVVVKIDRQLGTKHPKHGFMYMLNYGFIPNTISGDGEELDAYLVGVFEPVEEFEGHVIAVIHRTNDDDDKLVVAPKDVEYSDDAIRAMTEFQERFFVSVIIR